MQIKQRKEKHYFISAEAAKEKLENFELIYNFLLRLAEEIDMKTLTKPYIVKGSSHLPGITGFLIIETSHIAIHTYSEDGYFSLDVYSCKDFDENKVKELTLNFFNAKLLFENVF